MVKNYITSLQANIAMDALIITMVIYAGYFLVLYIDREEKSFDGKKAFGRAAQMLTIPVIAMFVMYIRN